MLTTVAVLVILLGLMVSLARHVRTSSAQILTKTLLTKLDVLMAQYQKTYDGSLPDVTPAIPPDIPFNSLSEETLARAARKNNEDFIRALRSRKALSSKEFSDLPVSIYDEVMLRDAWGSPMVLMTTYSAIGMPRDKYFFFSAGPDGKYGTTEDNIYSYDLSPSER